MHIHFYGYCFCISTISLHSCNCSITIAGAVADGGDDDDNKYFYHYFDLAVYSGVFSTRFYKMPSYFYHILPWIFLGIFVACTNGFTLRFHSILTVCWVTFIKRKNQDRDIDTNADTNTHTITLPYFMHFHGNIIECRLRRQYTIELY